MRVRDVPRRPVICWHPGHGITQTPDVRTDRTRPSSRARKTSSKPERHTQVPRAAHVRTLHEGNKERRKDRRPPADTRQQPTGKSAHSRGHSTHTHSLGAVWRPTHTQSHTCPGRPHLTMHTHTHTPSSTRSRAQPFRPHQPTDTARTLGMVTALATEARPTPTNTTSGEPLAKLQHYKTHDSPDCVRRAGFFCFETDKSRPPFLETLRDK